MSLELELYPEFLSEEEIQAMFEDQFDPFEVECGRG
jgi:hypothetical protein